MPERRTARLTLPAAGTTEAVVEVEPQPKRQRTMRAMAVLAVSLAAAPVVFFIPPHFLWPLVVLVAGAYFARRVWRGEYVVTSFEGACPRCGEPLVVDPGTRVRGRQRIECYGCHREPELVLSTGQEASV